MGTATQTSAPAAPGRASPGPTGTQPQPPQVDAPQQPRRKRFVVGLLAAVVIVAVVFTWRMVRAPGAGRVLEASGTVEATDAVLGFAAGGRIHAIALREGQTARAGSVLAELDTAELMAHVRQLRAQEGLASAQLRDLEQGSRPQELDDRRQNVTAAQKSLDDADLDLRRMRALIASGAVSQQTFDKAQLARDVAATRYAQAQAALSLAEEGARQQQVAAARASLNAMQAQAAALAATVPNYFIRAPWTGLVTDRVHEPGEAVAAGAPVLSVMNPDDRWVRIYIPENEVGAVHVGQSATITSDAYPDRSIVGHVRWISDEAEFTPRNVQTKDDRVRLVYAAKVQIDGDSAMVLKPGTPADVRVDLTPR